MMSSRNPQASERSPVTNDVDDLDDQPDEEEDADDIDDEVGDVEDGHEGNEEDADENENDADEASEEPDLVRANVKMCPAVINYDAVLTRALAAHPTIRGRAVRRPHTVRAVAVRLLTQAAARQRVRQASLDRVPATPSARTEIGRPPVSPALPVAARRQEEAALSAEIVALFHRTTGRSPVSVVGSRDPQRPLVQSADQRGQADLVAAIVRLHQAHNTPQLTR